MSPGPMPRAIRKTFRHQTGRLRPKFGVTSEFPRQREGAANQNGPGREARRRRRAARQEKFIRGSPPKPAATTPGVGLISPPPHLHDIYSIEDFGGVDSRFEKFQSQRPRECEARRRSRRRTHVAAGVAKAHADVVLISGHDGGTGASPLSSIKHAGGAVGTRRGRDPPDPGVEQSSEPHLRRD